MDWESWNFWLAFAIAIVSVFGLFWEIHSARRDLRTNTLLNLDERMDNEPVRQWRQIAAKKLLDNTQPNPELGKILDFFGTIAYMVESSAISHDLVYNEFAWWIIRYWECSKEYVTLTRQTDPMSWKTLQKVTERLKTREMHEGYTDESYSPENLKNFLVDETA